MDLLHSGLPDHPIDLLTIKHQEFTLTLSGRPVHPTVGKLQLLSEDRALLEIKSSNELDIKIFNPIADDDFLETYIGPSVFPFLYENQDYTLTLKAESNDNNLIFYHDNQRLRESIRPVRQVKGLYSGILNFRNEVGFTEFEVWNNGIRVLTIKSEIFPSKMDYHNDYVRLLQEVNDIVYNLAYDFLKKTFINAGIKSTSNPSEVEFFSIIQLIMKQFVQAVERIEAFPNSKMISEDQVFNIEKVRKANHKSQKWLAKNHNILKENTLGFVKAGCKNYFPQKLVDSKKIKSYDTEENRFIKWTLQQLILRLKSFKKQYVNAMQNRVDEAFLIRVDRLLIQVQRLSNKEFLKDVGNLSRLSISLVLQMAPGYREVYRDYLMLRKGLSLQSDLYKISPKEISTLYEYWSFLKIHQIMNSKYELIGNDVIKVNKNNGLFVTLEKSKTGKMVYRNSLNGERYELYYNPSYSKKSYTTGQKPDHVLTLYKEDSKQQFKFIFDTKYRINPAIEGTPYYDIYHTPGPMEEDINTMHRYRDAIIYEDSKLGRIMRDSYGAYVLFPYNDEEEYKEHKFYKSISQVNIGGLPFLPNHTKLFEELLFNLIEEDSESSFERNLLPHSTESFFARKKYQLDVLVGTIKDRKQYDAIVKQNFYHIQLFKVKNKLNHLNYIALYQHQGLGLKENGIVLIGKIKDFKIVQRKEIKEIPKNSDQYYVYFELESWERLDHVITPSGYGVRSFMMTNYELLKSADQLPELTLFNSFEQRLWRELKRLSKYSTFKSSEKWLDDQNSTIIKVNEEIELELFMDIDALICKYSNETITFTKNQIKYQPKMVISTIRKLLNK